MPFQIIRHNIAEVDVDAIINTTNTRPVIHGGADLTIHKFAGEELLKAREAFGIMKVGDAFITDGYNLKARHVIHVAAPVWGSDDAEVMLRQCYDRAFEVAYANKIRSLAFPLIGAGTYCFPPEVALRVALAAVNDFLMTHTMDMMLVVFDKKAFKLSQQLHNAVQSYIDEHYVEELVQHEYLDGQSVAFNRRGRQKRQREKYSYEASVQDVHQMADDFQSAAAPVSYMDYGTSLEDLLKTKDKSFADALLSLIDRKGLTDAYVYKKANVDRKLFNKIKLHPDYQPRKTTCLAFAVALELNLDETMDLISHAGYALSHSSKVDIIVEYFIKRKEYNIYEINSVLFDYDCPILGSK